jgi:hypothetical protein
VDSWAAHGRGWVTFECSHLHDYLQLALMLRHPDLQIPHAAQRPYLFRIRGVSEIPQDVIECWFVVSTPLTEPQCFRQPRCALHFTDPIRTHPHWSPF